jgi:plasmid stability protein
MSSLTVRNLDESVKNSLRVRAARHGLSMEEEVRQILQKIVAPEQAGHVSFAERVNSRFTKLKVDSLPIPARQAARTPPTVDTPGAEV